MSNAQSLFWPLPPVEGRELQLLKMTPPYNTLTAEAQKWLLWEHNHSTAFRSYSQGCFTLRIKVVSGRWKTTEESIAAGKTHGLFLFNEYKLPREEDERILAIFLVDLRMALLHAHLASEHRINKLDKNEYLVFDPLVRGVERFCERLRLPL